MTHADTPIIVGTGQITVRDEPMDSLSRPIDLIEQSIFRAAEDAGITRPTLTETDQIAVVRSFREPMRNTPEAVARRLGAEKAELWLTPDGGEGPQALVNLFAAKIADGNAKLVVLAGAEAMNNGRRLVKSGTKPDWAEPSDQDPTFIFPDRQMQSAAEEANGIFLPSTVFALVENAIRHHLGRSINDHQMAMGELFARFSNVAAETPTSWYKQRRTAGEIATPGPKNRFVGWPYTKLMNAMNQINQGAALILTSVGHAKSLGIPQDRWVYLHGGAKITDIWHFTERPDFHRSEGMRLANRATLDMAGMEISDIDLLDLYSCFPGAVEMAMDALELAADDPRSLTVTGGLAYHGGAGNNYSMNAIATMCGKLRAAPDKTGLVSSAGAFISKHASGIYSTAPTRNGTDRWRAIDIAPYQQEIDDTPPVTIADAPEGTGTVETYTVLFNRDNEPTRAIVVGRLGDVSDPSAPRFLANTAPDRDLMLSLTRENLIGHTGRVSPGKQHNFFDPA